MRPPKVSIRQWDYIYKLGLDTDYKQWGRLLTSRFMDQLDRCADDSTRKVLLGLYDGKASKGSKGIPGRKASVQSIADHRPRRIPQKAHSYVEPAERVVLLMQLATGKR